ncbi:MAG TPA: hypothetical protein VGC54_08040 [Planctomycetota bacterium]
MNVHAERARRALRLFRGTLARNYDFLPQAGFAGFCVGKKLVKDRLARQFVQCLRAGRAEAFPEDHPFDLSIPAASDRPQIYHGRFVGRRTCVGGFA